MAFRTRTSQMVSQNWDFQGVTLGTVVDTNDPQQMGRLRVQCLALNDPADAPLNEYPWASYAAPFAGTIQRGTRGEDNNEVSGPVAYGMWAIPKVGSQVLVMCLDGNPQTRVWIGCLHVELAAHTMPHGRFSYRDDNRLPSDDDKPIGPFSSFENSIEPLHSNLRTAFDTDNNNNFSGQQNFEFQTRGADFQASGVVLGQTVACLSEVEDDDGVTTGNTAGLETSRQGYEIDRIAPNQENVPVTGRKYDNTVTSIVSPGFHALSMDDRAENCRVRVRTTGGHQIIMDDTNERVYISTATGENWIEMDEKGNIDIYTSGKISAHAEHDINFTTDRSFRVYAKAGIHLKSDKEVRIQSEEDISVKTKNKYRVKADDDILMESGRDIHQKSSSVFIESQEVTNLKVGGEFTVQAADNANIVGANVNLNSGGTASSANEADPSDDFNAFFTNRIPDHEPWARSDTKNNDGITPQFSYTSINVGKKRRITAMDGINDETDTDIINIERGDNWRR